MIKAILRKLKNVREDFCVTILLKTHRTHPENKQDPIELKNLAKEAEERLLQEYDKRDIPNTLKNLETIQETIDHQFNQEGLAIFINENICEYVRLPIDVEDRVVIDETFATRDLVRALNQSEHYFILTLSEQEGHLYYAFRDKIGETINHHGFPFENHLYTTEKWEKSMAKTEDNFIREFFNRIDKAFQEAYKEHPGKVVVAGVERNFSFYKEIADHPELIIGHINKNRDDANLHELGKDAWEVVLAYLNKQKEEALSAIGIAASQNKLFSDLTDIWPAVRMGRGHLLFVEEGFFQAALVSGDEIELLEDPKAIGAVDDLIDEIIEHQLMMKGEVIFLPEGTLDQYNRIALVTRY